MRPRSVSGEARQQHSMQQMETEGREWIEGVLGRTLEGALHEALKTGVVLCEVANKVKSSICPPPSKSKLPFHQMENISAYLRACTVLGIPTHELFQTVDLFEAKNMKAVLINLQSLGRIAQQSASFQGPKLGVRDNSRLSVSRAASGVGATVAASGTKEGYVWPVQQAHVSMLTLLAEAAAAALKAAQAKKLVAAKAQGVAAQKANVLATAERDYSLALQEAPQRAPELKLSMEQAETEAAKANEAAQSAQVAAEEAEVAAIEAKAAYDAEAAAQQQAQGGGGGGAGEAAVAPLSIDDALFSSLGGDEQPPPASAAAAPMVVPPPIPPVDAVPPVAVEGKEEAATSAGRELSAALAASEELKQALVTVEAERDALRAMCGGLQADLRDAQLREKALRRMISLALEEVIPPATEVTDASFAYTPAV